MQHILFKYVFTKKIFVSIDVAMCYSLHDVDGGCTYNVLHYRLQHWKIVPEI